MLRNSSLRARQRGVTFVGWIVLLIPVAMVGYAALRVVPMYLNYTRVVRTMNDIASEAEGDTSATAETLRRAIDKRLNIEGVEYPETKDFVIRRDGQVWVVEIAYEETSPYISNVGLLVTFKKSVSIGKGKSLE